MKRTIFFCYIALILLLAPTTYGQTSPAAYDRLDSIMLTGNPEAAMTYWSTVCKPSTEESYETACQIKAEQLQNLIEFVAAVKTQTPTYISELITNGKSQSDKYTVSYAGPASAQAFQSFLSAADSNDQLQAITYLRTARFFMISFLKKSLAEAHHYYAKADSQFEQGNFESAASTLKSISLNAGKNRALIAYADTISSLQQRINSKLKQIEKRQFYWERTDAVDSRFSFSLTSKIISQPGSKNFPLIMSRGNSTITVEIDRIIPTYRFGLGLQAWYSLNERFSVGAGADAATFVYNSELTQQLIFFDFDVAYSRAFVGGQYLLRSAVGLRPYLNLGLGVMRYKYDEFDAVIYRELTGYETYQVDGDDFTSGEATVTIGSQFVPKSDSPWAISSELSWYHPFKEHLFLPLPRISVSMRVDLLI